MNTGDRVVCIKTDGRGLTIKDKTYPVLDTMTFPCGCVAIDVGYKDDHELCYCGMHNGPIVESNGVLWMLAYRFAPIVTDEFPNSDEIDKIVEEKIDIEIPIEA